LDFHCGEKICCRRTVDPLHHFFVFRFISKSPYSFDGVAPNQATLSKWPKNLNQVQSIGVCVLKLLRLSFLFYLAKELEAEQWSFRVMRAEGIAVPRKSVQGAKSQRSKRRHKGKPHR
jgi:hypothetical protein